jgi:hypothetical protein
MKKAIIFIILTFAVLNIYSAGTKKIQISVVDIFNNGQRENLTVTENGFLSLGGDLKAFHSKGDLVISDIKKDKLGNIYIATGKKGKVYKKTPKGKLSVFFKAAASNVISLAVSKSFLYAVTFPDVKLYRVSLKTGKSKVLATFSEKYVWQIAIGADNKIYAACGDKAAVYSVDLSGAKKLVYKNEADNNFLAIKSFGKNIYFASEGAGGLYRYSILSKKTKLLYQTYEGEITSMFINKTGDIYFATGSKDKKKLSFNGFDYTDSFIKQLSGSKRFSSKVKYLKNSVYVLRRNGKVEKLFTKDNFVFYSLCVSEGNVYAGSGNNGIIFKIDKKGMVYYHCKLDQRDIPVIYNYKKGVVLVGTANTGMVYTLTNVYAPMGSYVSKVYDAKISSKWGRVDFDADVPSGSSIVVYTRTGDNLNPDNTWEGWKKASADFLVKSSAARFIQFKIILKSKHRIKSPFIREVTFYHLPENRYPRVFGLVFKAGVAPKKTGGLDYNVCNISWKATDPDGDKLIYSLFVRKSGYKLWKVLVKKTGKNNITFDSRVFPDGKYYFKVVANDSLSNSEGRALSNYKVSQPVVIDNTPPVFFASSLVKIKKGWAVNFTVTDNLSNIIKVQASVNWGDWLTLLPKDGIYDSKKEMIYFVINKKSIENINRGENVVVFRVADGSGNIKTKMFKFIN